MSKDLYYTFDEFVTAYENDSSKPYERKCVKSTSSKDDNNSKRYLIDELAEHIFSSKKFSMMPYLKSNGEFIRDNFAFNRHLGQYGKSLKNEKPLCRSWFNNGFPKELSELGVPIDYESNIAMSKVNIDLTSFNGKKLCLIEVKGTINKKSGMWETDETLLRALLEIETYYETLVCNNNLQIYINSVKSGIPEKDFDRTSISVNDVDLYIVIPSGSFAEKMYKEPHSFPYVHKLLERYSIKVLIYDKKQPEIIR